MKGNALRILILEIVCILFSIICIIFTTKLSEYIISAFLATIFGVSIFLLGFKKDRYFNQRKKLLVIGFIILAILFLTYVIGFLSGFASSSYDRSVVGIISNVFPIILLIVFSELLRFQFCYNKDKFNIILSIIVFVLIDIIYSLNFYDISNNFVLLEFICVIILPSISKNIVMGMLSKNYGYSITLIYCLIMGVYEYIVPIVPNYGEYISSIVSILIPIFNMQLINFYLRKRVKEDIRDKKTGSKIFIILCVIFSILLIGIYSNLFRYWVATIASGSMSPTIEVGDIVVVDKWYSENPDALKVGDVLVFRVKDTLYTHRIINIIEKNGVHYIKTKGDYKDNAEDNWVVLKNDIVGKVSFKIKYLGLPSVWLHNLLSKEI